jgi:hypothetical protein
MLFLGNDCQGVADVTVKKTDAISMAVLSDNRGVIDRLISAQRAWSSLALLRLQFVTAVPHGPVNQH